MTIFRADAVCRCACHDPSGWDEYVAHVGPCCARTNLIGYVAKVRCDWEGVCDLPSGHAGGHAFTALLPPTKRQGGDAMSHARWSVVIHHNGQPVTGPVPCTDWDTAGLIAQFFAGWSGGRVSVGNAVVSARPPADPIPSQLDLLDEP